MDIQNHRKPVVLVTGASRGIGLGVITCLLKDHNASVVAVSRNSNDSLVALAAKHQDTLIIVLGDIADPNTSVKAVAVGLEHFGRLDAIVLNAAVVEPTGAVADIPVDSSSDADATVGSWKALFDVNFFSLIHTIQCALPALRKTENHSEKEEGKIILVSSKAAIVGKAGMGPYSTSKAAMNSLAQTLGNEEQGVVTVALWPGTVDTDMQTHLRQSQTIPDVQWFKDVHADGKLIRVEDSSYTIASLALSASPVLSGKFVDWDADACAPYRRRE